MSGITSAVLICDISALARDDRHLLTEPVDGSEQSFGLVDDRSSGGDEDSGLAVYTAGFSYMDPVALERWFYALPWRSAWRETVLLYVLHEYREGPMVYGLGAT